jgi:hexosaminidase
MVDAARNFHSMDFHIRTVKKLASYKINRYMIHFSDHESYTLPSDLYPGLPTRGRSYTREEIRQLVETAENYHLTIVPSVDVPGHAAALINGIPELKFDGGRIDIAKEETYRILQSLFSEIMELIPGTYWHLGADEVSYPDITESPNESYRAWMDGLNLTKGGQLFNSFINRMYDFVKGKGKKMLIWEGFNPRLEPAVNREITVCPFDVMHEGIMPRDYMDAGYKLLNTSWTPLYIADGIYMITPEILAKWTPYMFGKARNPHPFDIWIKYKPDDIPTEIIGAQVCSWAIEEKAEWGLWFGKEAGPGFPDYGRPEPRVQVFSERTWNSKPSEKSLLERTGAAYWEF